MNNMKLYLPCGRFTWNDDDDDDDDPSLLPNFEEGFPMLGKEDREIHPCV